MMKRRWSNNGGFAALRMLDESSSEVTSSSAGLVAMTTAGGMTMSPTSLGSPEYSELELWYEEPQYPHQHHGVITAAVTGVPNNQHHTVITASEPKGKPIKVCNYFIYKDSNSRRN